MLTARDMGHGLAKERVSAALKHCARHATDRMVWIAQHLAEVLDDIRAEKDGRESVVPIQGKVGQ